MCCGCSSPSSGRARPCHGPSRHAGRRPHAGRRCVHQRRHREADRLLTRDHRLDCAPALRVLAPDGKGPWPVVVALHGYGGTGRDMVELATRVARAGAVVFAPTYHTDLRTAQGLVRARDISCAYRIALRSARRYGGDLSQPITVVGWSLGADLSVLGALLTPVSIPAPDDAPASCDARTWSSPCPAASTGSRAVRSPGSTT